MGRLALPEITYQRTINAPRRRVFEIATDYAALERRLPEYFPSVRILSSRNETTVSEEHVILDGYELVMMARHTVRYPVQHTICVIGGDGRGSRIIQTYQEEDDMTRVTLEADMRFGLVKSIKMLRVSPQRGLVQIMDGIARVCES